MIGRPVHDLGEAEQLGHLLVEQLQSHAGREPCEHRLRHVFDDLASQRERQEELEDADIDRRRSDPRRTEIFRQREHHHAERGGGAGRLVLGAPQERCSGAADHTRDQPCARRHPARDCEANVEGERDRRHGQPRQEIAGDRPSASYILPGLPISSEDPSDFVPVRALLWAPPNHGLSIANSGRTMRLKEAKSCSVASCNGA